MEGEKKKEKHKENEKQIKRQLDLCDNVKEMSVPLSKILKKEDECPEI